VVKKILLFPYKLARGLLFVLSAAIAIVVIAVGVAAVAIVCCALFVIFVACISLIAILGALNFHMIIAIIDEYDLKERLRIKIEAMSAVPEGSPPTEPVEEEQRFNR